MRETSTQFEMRWDEGDIIATSRKFLTRSQIRIIWNIWADYECVNATGVDFKHIHFSDKVSLRIQLL